MFFLVSVSSPLLLPPTSGQGVLVVYLSSLVVDIGSVFALRSLLGVGMSGYVLVGWLFFH